MKATIQISIEVHDLADLEAVERLLGDFNTPQETTDEPAPVKRKATKKKGRRKKAAPKKPPVEEPVQEDEDAGEDQEAPVPVTRDEVLEAAQEASELVGLEKITEIFKSYGCARFSDFKEEQWPELLEKLKAV